MERAMNINSSCSSFINTLHFQTTNRKQIPTFTRTRTPRVFALDNINKPDYVPTPRNRLLRTPHSGYHFDGSTRKFFEGWCFKVSIPEKRQSFCFMYSVENPAFRKKLTKFEEVTHGPTFTGVGAQILGADDKYICQYVDESQNFWGSAICLL